MLQWRIVVVLDKEDDTVRVSFLRSLRRKHGHVQEELAAGEEIARCPSCSLYITVIYNPEDFQGDEEEEAIRPPALQPIPA